MQSIDFIEQFAQGVVIIGCCFTNARFRNTFLLSSKGMSFASGHLTVGLSGGRRAGLVKPIIALHALGRMQAARPLQPVLGRFSTATIRVASD
jgi:hypothetical protein